VNAQRNEVSKKISTPSHKEVHEEKKNDHFSLSLCLLRFFGGFVFEDFTCDMYMHSL
jgi:hypothetical protein